MLDLDPRDASGVYRPRILHALPGEIHACEVGERTARADDLRAAPVADRQMRAQRLTDIAAEPAYAAPEGAAAGFDGRSQELLAEADRAEGKGDQPIEQPVGAERELDRATADVHDDPSSDAQVEVCERAAEGEAGLILAAQRAHAEPGLGADPVDKGAAVGGVSDRARGDGFDAARTELTGERGHPAQRRDRGQHRLGA